MSVVDEVKDRTDIVEVIGETVDLKKSGKNYTGFCPFHSNTRTPAFVVFPDTATWRCFGACNEGGDVFTFLMKREGYEFSEALRVLAERAGVELKPRTPEQEARVEEHERLRQLLETAVTFYHHQLMKTPAGEEALQYLKSRGFTDETIESFQLGYAPDSWEVAAAYLKESGYSESDLLDAGVVSERDSGGVYDRFRNRLMIPIRDPRGRMAGFGARVLDPEDVPKYLNSPQTDLFDKGRLLYGLDKARRSIRSEDRSVIVEGYMDVIGLHQAGFENAVSSMGTALSEDQLRQLKRYSRKIVLALDADTAGDRATLRGLEVARQALDREPDPVFAARGLVRYEGRLDAELRIVTLPEGQDPDEVVVEDPEAWSRLMDSARTVVDYVMDVLSADLDLEDAKHKAQVAEQVLPLIEDVADPVEREAYRQKLARRLRIDERTLLTYVPRSRRSGRPIAKGTSGGASSTAGATENRLESFCLGVLLKAPETLYRLDREMQALDLERIGERDFSSADRRVIFAAVRSALEQHDEEPALQWRQDLEEHLLESADELIRQVDSISFDQPKVRSEILAAFLRLRQSRLGVETRQVHFQLMEAQESAESGQDPETDVDHLKHAVHKLALQKDRLDRALSLQGLAGAGVAQGS